MSTRRGETLTPNTNECNSTLTSGTNNINPYPYIDVNDRGHRLGFIQPLRRPCFEALWLDNKHARASNHFDITSQDLSVKITMK